ncbi:Protein CBG27335 [Caenorhabditis briggsae]|uniref:Protein CBG23817 n=1 Tax=Caenorhabditis briggsae TaxID=6238 RepID=G2J663_CAEBR|nr:Protein CBG23817 [Caenorhabditis briggsae]XP_045100646.1 Protein CBG27335 [Caenorhabditis briggsae]CAP20573.2 Protein CBG23817 [Caenorhabditis briggsae]CAS01089.1 Protein CBG27335 [Caenorhabditis briggsae]
MCIGFIKVATSPDEKYKLILLNNRDEDLDRPTAKIHWHDGILSGVDEKDVARGTWLGINPRGKIGMLLSITQPIDTKHTNAPSRGGIVNDFLKTESLEFLENLKIKAEQFNGFQFVGIEKNANTGLFEVRSLTNQLVRDVEVVKWEDKLFQKSLENSDQLEREEIFGRLFEIATCQTQCFPDEQIRVQTGFPGDVYRPLTSIFVRFPETRRYGTRSHTIILVDRNDEVTVLERRMVAAEKVSESTWLDERVEFKL